MTSETRLNTAVSADAINRMLIERACERLSVQFGLFNDTGRFRELADLFTHDGRLVRPLAPDAPLQGREAILNDFTEKLRGFTVRHVFTNILINVEASDRATGITYYTVYRQEGVANPGQAFDFEGVVYLGEYHDVFVHTTDGWRFQARDGRIVMRLQPTRAH